MYTFFNNPAHNTKRDKLSMQGRVRLMILGALMSITVVLNESKKLDGYKFPVYSTPFCPQNESEWAKRSSVLNCNETNGFTCLPNEKLTELLEFCYTQRWILIEEGYCLYLKKNGSYVDSYSCRHFLHGCHKSSYQSTRIYEHPACISLGNGCFLAEQSCESYHQMTVKTISRITTPYVSILSSPKTTHRPETPVNDKDDWLWLVIPLEILLFFVCVTIFWLYHYRKKKICRKGPDIESEIQSDENTSLINKNEKSNGEPQIEKAIFGQWEQEDDFFIPTKAFKEVEKHIKSSNLVIVTGHSGSGKSAIIQHIALKHKKQGWTVRRIQKIDDIRKEYSSGQFQKDKTIFILNDPFGNESFDEILNNSWKTCEEELKLYIQTAKLMMSCRTHIINDGRLAHYLVNQSHIINIDDDKYKLSVNEKRQILTKYTSAMNLSEKDRNEIVKVEMHFPLLCKLYSKKEYTNKGIGFFTEPVEVLREEIKGFRQNDKGKYCALALLVLFNNDLCVSDLFKNTDTEDKFKYTLKLCGLQENTSPYTIGDLLYSIKDCFVKKVGNRYNFCHDFVMEVSTHVFGTDYPRDTIKYADIGFLRRRVRLENSEENCEENKDSFTIYLSDQYIKELGERLYTELFGEHLLDVVLNPCLRNEKVIEVLKENIADHPNNLQMLLEKKHHTINEKALDKSSQSVLSKIEFWALQNEVSPLFSLIVFCHTQISQYCIQTLQQKEIDITSSFLFSAMCCNGSIELFNSVFKNNANFFLKKALGGLYPIHAVSAFQNYELLHVLIDIGVNVNRKTEVDYVGWTPLMLAAGNDTQEYEDNNFRESGKTKKDQKSKRRDETVQILMLNGADINLCSEDGTSPLFIACQDGHDSTVQLLLSYGADTNLCMNDGASPLFIACEDGHDSTVQLLLSNGADINLCMNDGASPLYVACQKGHDSTVKLLLSNGADINLCINAGASPLFIACQNGHDSTVQLLLSNGADINLCMNDGASPLYIACQKGHDSTVQLLLSNGADTNLCMNGGTSPLFIACEDGHDSIVQLLLSNGADTNLCMDEGANPLFIACQKGDDSTVQLLLSKGADINLCMNDGASPLYIACQDGHDSTVKLLLSNGADTNLCMNGGTSPLFIACAKGHDSIVQLLLSNGADTNLCTNEGVSPLFIACQKGDDSTIQLLLSKGADINLCMNDGTSPLYLAGAKGHDSTVKLLLSNGADINLCMNDGASPLFIACQDRHDSTVQL
ncbi:uncharacterized protein [Magallana gigas]|uniref:uncharacterized protein n=1 Tax=Magallana gigas TaxID=29159 RepID=UPI00333E603D